MSNAPADQPIHVFVSSPGNLRSERLLVVKICRRLSQSMGIRVEPLLWEGGGREEPDVSSFPAYVSGEGAQHEIDKRLWEEIGGCDIYVGMIWHRMGTPTGDWRSGTEAEYQGALRARKETGRPSDPIPLGSPHPVARVLGQDTRSRLHFDKDNRVAVPADQIDLPQGAVVIPCENPIAAALEVLGRSLLAAPTERLSPLRRRCQPA